MGVGRERLTFVECVMLCAANRELVENFDQLQGTNLLEIGARSTIAAMIDEATGRDAESVRLFIEFVHECVWTRLSGVA